MICDASTTGKLLRKCQSVLQQLTFKLQYTPYSTDSATLLTHFFKSCAVHTDKENGANSDTLLEIPCYIFRKVTLPHMRTQLAAVSGS
jgi:hypothetical protein